MILHFPLFIRQNTKISEQSVKKIRYNTSTLHRSAPIVKFKKLLVAETIYILNYAKEIAVFFRQTAWNSRGVEFGCKWTSFSDSAGNFPWEMTSRTFSHLKISIREAKIHFFIFHQKITLKMKNRHKKFIFESFDLKIAKNVFKYNVGWQKNRLGTFLRPPFLDGPT